MKQPRVRYIDTGITVDPAYDSQGRLIDDAYVDRVVEEVHREVDRRAGRPSLTGESGHSPQVQIRLSPQLKNAIDLAAAADHTSRAEWMRRVLQRAATRRLAKRS